jgi:hypothetical protein
MTLESDYENALLSLAIQVLSFLGSLMDRQSMTFKHNDLQDRMDKYKKQMLHVDHSQSHFWILL